jgi:hypothetical protein
MIDYKSFSLPGNGVLRIRSEKIIATISSKNEKGDDIIDIYCADTTNPFHIKATKHSPREIIDYIWNIPSFEEEEDF